MKFNHLGYWLLSFVVLIMLGACGEEEVDNDTSQGESNNTSQQETESSEEEQQAQEEQFTLNFATPDPSGASISVAAEEFAKRVEEESDGSIVVNVHPDGSLYGGDPSAAVNQLGDGSLDLLALSSTVYANFEPEFNAFSVPYLFDDQEQYLDLLNDEIGQMPLEKIENSGIEGLYYWPRNFRQITNSQRPIHEPADLEGLKLRVPNNPLWVDFFEEAGASPSPMDFGEVYNALQLGTIDGQENPIEIPMNASFYEVQDYASLTNHMADAWVVGMNQEKFEELSQEQQSVIQDVSEDMQEWLRAYDSDQVEDIMKGLEEEGMEINEVSDENHQKFVEISQSLYPTFRDVVENDEYFDKVLEFVGKSE